MPRFQPFRGVRYDPRRADPALVTAPPYDVIDEPSPRRAGRRHPDNVVLIDLPGDRATTPTRGAAPLLDAGWPKACCSATSRPSTSTGCRHLRGRRAARHTTGVFGALDLSRPGEGDILPHEHTTPKAKSDRLNLLRATRANLSPMWGLSPAPGLSQLLDLDEAASGLVDLATASSTPSGASPTRTGSMPSPTSVGAHPVVIADGHHRYETSLTYRDEQRAAAPGAPGAEAVLAYVVELVDDELDVLPIHRLLSGLPEGSTCPLR